MYTLIKNARLVNEGEVTEADLLIKDRRIDKIASSISAPPNAQVIDAAERYLMPGAIDDQVHFREPGLTHKASIGTESAAAVAGGVTSYMEMPNTNPPAVTIELLEKKFDIAAQHSLANYSFFMGVTNDNADEVLRCNDLQDRIGAIKIFMGSSTGNMLVDNYVTLDRLFRETELIIATHCEDEAIIAAQREKYPHPEHARMHPVIRNREACFSSSFSAVQLAKQHNTRLHVFHITTADELRLFSNMLPLAQKRITSEVCVHHLSLNASDYETLGNKIKCNPAIKDASDQEALWEALLDDRLDVIATDHAPHTLEEKGLPYQQAPAGLPLVQHPVLLMLEHVRAGRLPIPKMVQKMCHAPAVLFRIPERGFLREGYYADLVLIGNEPYTVSKENILYKCGWSPFEGTTFSHRIDCTWVNGELVYADGKINDGSRGDRLVFAP